MLKIKILFLILLLLLSLGCVSKPQEETEEKELNTNITNQILKVKKSIDDEVIELKFTDTVIENAGTVNEQICLCMSVGFRIAQIASQYWNDGIFKTYEIKKIKTGWNTEGVWELFSNKVIKEKEGVLGILEEKINIEKKDGSVATAGKNLTKEDAWYEIVFTNSEVIRFSWSEGEEQVYPFGFLALRSAVKNGDQTKKQEMQTLRKLAVDNLSNIPFDRIKAEYK